MKQQPATSTPKKKQPLKVQIKDALEDTQVTTAHEDAQLDSTEIESDDSEAALVGKRKRTSKTKSVPTITGHC